MSKLWSKAQALGGEGQIMQNNIPLPIPAIQRYVREAANVSSVITLSDNTTNLEIFASGSPAFVRWIGTADTQASVIAGAAGPNYDNVVPSGQVRKFVVPKESIGTNSVVGANIAYGLYRRVAFITSGAGSVLATEY